MKVHFIAIGGAAMHNLAIALNRKGYQVSGSDDQVFDPSKTRLKNEGVLPDQMGWFPEKISSELDAIILGMHARIDNPELLRAQELGLKIYSYPEYLYEQSKNKTRVVIGGSHGKTTITSMVLHVLNYWNIKHDYMVGAQLEGYDCMVGLTEDAPIIILEGDEYLSSPIDRRPKFHHYKPNVALLSGIAWDHINVFPTFENYVEQFSIFVDDIADNGGLAYYDGDKEIVKIVSKANTKAEMMPYNTPGHKIENGVTYVYNGANEIPLKVFGEHILQNLEGAKLVLSKLDVSSDQFYEAIQTFKGASKRMEIIAENPKSLFVKDFAHSPSKLKATTKALKDQFKTRELIACMELHTFSSLNRSFLEEYKGSMKDADRAYVYFNPEVIKHKKLDAITKIQVQEAFGSDNVQVFTDSNELITLLEQEDYENKNLLLMTSGNFNGVNIDSFLKELSNK